MRDGDGEREGRVSVSDGVFWMGKLLTPGGDNVMERGVLLSAPPPKLYLSSTHGHTQCGG